MRPLNPTQRGSIKSTLPWMQEIVKIKLITNITARSQLLELFAFQDVSNARAFILSSENFP